MKKKFKQSKKIIWQFDMNTSIYSLAKLPLEPKEGIVYIDAKTEIEAKIRLQKKFHEFLFQKGINAAE